MTCRRGLCHAIQGALLGALIGHALLYTLQKSVGLRLMIRTSPESVHQSPALGDKAGNLSTTWDK